ncbi:transporter [Acidocella sp.]|uniref:SphA family protein n=1 Tax=Acidocella sp. TaxID=50710 RepID=UPI002627F5F9|nr:transporter [Acidocella sp.]
MRKTTTVRGLAAIAAVTVMQTQMAKANEMWTGELPNIKSATPEGVLPPPGVYGQLDNYFAQFETFDSVGNKIPSASINALIEVPTLLWVPGITVLGANYGVAVAIPFVYNSYQPLQRATPGPGNLGLFNTVIAPAILSWTLSQHLFVSTTAAFLLPDQTNDKLDLYRGSLKNGGAPTGNSYSSFMPSLGLTWMDNGWTLNVGLRVSLTLGPTTSEASFYYQNPYGAVSWLNGYHYHTGDFFVGDYTLTKTFGAWSFGGAIFNSFQLQKDTLNGQPVPGSIYRSFSIGPVIGYQFKSGMGITALWGHSVTTNNGVGGDAFDLRLTTRF